MQLLQIDSTREALISDDEDSSIAFAAISFINSAALAIKERGSFSVALSGGSTPKKLYETILKSDRADQVDWSRVNIFWSDERAVPPDSEESNYGMAMHYFCKEPLDVSKKFRMPADEQDLDKAAVAYEAQIRKHCVGERFDLVLLGIGDDGHTASLFPNTKALQVEDKLVVANFVPEKNAYRMTLTFPCINDARKIIVLAFGKAKAKILKTVLFGKPDFEKYPAQRVGQGKAATLYIIDREAASALPIKLVDSFPPQDEKNEGKPAILKG